MGKSRGKIGNVVLSVNKGQTIAKQLNPAPANPRTAPQVNGRNQMANAVLAWQYGYLFLVGLKGLRKPLESTYNAFVRLVKTSMNNALAVDRVVAFIQAISTGKLVGNFINSSVNVAAGDGTVTLNTLGLPFVAGSVVRLAYISAISGEMKVAQSNITEAQWNAGSLTIANFQHDTDTTHAICYVYTSDYTKCGTVSIVPMP